MIEREKKLRKIAEHKQSSGSDANLYSKYGDYNPSDVHEGTASYGGNTYADSPMTNKTQYSSAVKRGHQKDAFIFQKQLYQINNTSGTSYSEVQV